MFEQMLKVTGPSQEWLDQYKAKNRPRPGGPGNPPLLAYCYEIVLGSYAAAVVVPCIQEDGEDYRAVLTLHARLANLRLNLAVNGDLGGLALLALRAEILLGRLPLTVDEIAELDRIAIAPREDDRAFLNAFDDRLADA
jgi:hypothetical protein